MSPPNSEQHAPVSSISAVEVKTVHRARASIQNRPQVNPTDSAEPESSRPVKATAKDCAQSSSSISAYDTSRDGRSPASRREDRWRAFSNGPSTATGQTNSSAIVSKGGLMHPSPSVSAALTLHSMRSRFDRENTFQKTHSQHFRPGSNQKQHVILPPTNVEGSIPSRKSQQRLANLLTQQAGWTRQSVASGTKKGANGDGATSSKGSPQDYSVVATGDQFFPPPIDGEVLLPGCYEPGLRGGACSPAGKIGIGIEVEFLLKALEPENRRSNLDKFSDTIALKHNISVGNEHPKMKNEVFNFVKRTSFEKWALTTDPSMSTHREPCR